MRKAIGDTVTIKLGIAKDVILRNKMNVCPSVVNSLISLRTDVSQTMSVSEGRKIVIRADAVWRKI